VECDAELAGRLGLINGSAKSNSQVEVIVGVAWIVLDRPFEIVSGFLLTAAGGDHSQVVVHLGQRQAGGDELKGAFGLVEVSMSVAAETKIDIRFASDLRGGRNLFEGSDCWLVRPLAEESFAQLQPSFSK